MRKRLLSVLLALCMVITLPPRKAFAATVASGTCGNNLNWVLDDEGTLTISGTGAMTDYDFFDDYSPWYSQRNAVTAVVIDSGVTSIGSYAFYQCKLKSVVIPNSVTTIGDCAFYNCSSLISVKIPDGVTSISYAAFAGCDSLASATIPNSVISIEDAAFLLCSNLKSVDIPEGVTSIGAGAFMNCDSLKSVDIPDSVTTIGEEAFRECGGLTSVTIGSSVASIGDDAFYMCSSLINVTIGDNVTSIGKSTFSWCSSLNSVIIPGSVTTIGDFAFEHCESLTNVKILDGATTIGEAAFYNCRNLKSVIIPDSVASIGQSAFLWCTSLNSVSIPNRVTEIKRLTFGGCTSLTNVTIPKSVTNIGDYAFQECNKLSDVYYAGSKEDWDSIQIGSDNECLTGAEIHYNSNGANKEDDATMPEGSGTCGANLTWTLGADGTLTISGTGEMYDYDNIGLDQPWYQYQEQIQTLSIGNEVTSIGQSAFRSCSNLKHVTIPSSVISIGTLAFHCCFGLSSVVISEGVESIGNYAFGSCNRLTSVNIPVSVTNIETFAFNSCIGLTSINVESGNSAYSSIDGVLFNKEQTRLCIYPQEKDGSSFNIPESVTTIGQAAFENCDNLTNVTIPDSVTTIEWYAFRDCDSLTDVYYGGSQSQWNQISIGGSNEPLTNATIHYNSIEISSIDLLALSLLSYGQPKGNPKNKSIRELIDDELIDHKWDEYWDKNWEKAGIRNSELFASLADWKVYNYWSDESTGFAAYAFYNDSNDFVIAYRGSIPLSEIASDLSDFWNDWVKNDLWMYIGGEGAQVNKAMEVYETVAKENGRNIIVTGHSLGGGLADIIAACYGCKGESFNSAPFLDVVYGYHSVEMAELFEGTDAFTFTAHANDGDVVIGNNFAEKIKPLWLHEGNGLVSSAHSLASIVTRDTNGSLRLTKQIGKRFSGIVDQLLISILFNDVNDVVVLGTTQNNTLKYSGHLTLYGQLTQYETYGGAGNDNIITDIWNDTISGGMGNDTIDGSWGSDTYIYYKGHGVDTIHDTSGNDTLVLYGFSANDTIRVEEGNDDYAYITVNGSVIVKIAKRRSNPMTSWNNSFTVVISNQGFEQNIESYLKDTRSFIERLLFSCPVNVEIVNDATGEVVYTLYDQTEETAYTEYGNFYVFEQEDGEYVKIADLIEGYSARVVGVGSGTMDVVVLDTDGFNLSEPYTAQDVPVTKEMIATVEEDGNGGKNLVIDTDADGQPDSIVPLTTSEDTQTTYTISVSASPTVGGSVTGGGTYNENTSVTVKATPASGYRFVGWMEGNTIISVNSIYTFEAKANRTLTAVFERINIGDDSNPSYQITVSATSNGTVAVTPTSAKSGTKVTITATPNDGYKVDSVTVKDNSGNSVSVTDNGDGTYTFTMTNGPVTVSATFTSIGGNGGGGGSTPSNPGYQITVPTTSNGTVTVTPTSAKSGTKVTITATPNDGYKVGSVTVRDASGNTMIVTSLDNNQYSFTMPNGKVTVDVTFVPIQEPWTNPFTDVSKSDWFYDGVAYVAQSGLMQGVGGGKFNPSGTTTRGMIVTILYRLENEPTVSQPAFTDVAAGQYYTEAVAWAAANKIVDGYGNNTFGPNDVITREQMATILYRYADYKGYDVSGLADLSSYTDAETIHDWALTAIRWANKKGLITGRTTTTLVPQGTATRAEAAVILARFCQDVAGLE